MYDDCGIGCWNPRKAYATTYPQFAVVVLPATSAPVSGLVNAPDSSTSPAVTAAVTGEVTGPESASVTVADSPLVGVLPIT